jgi:hypothetical protein
MPSECQNASTSPSSCHLKKHNFINSLQASLNERIPSGDDDLKALPPKISPLLQEGLHMLRKGQIEGIAKGDVLAQNCVINQLFG